MYPFLTLLIVTFISGHVNRTLETGLQSVYEARYAAQDDEFLDESWELMHQFLGAPLRIRLTTFLRHQFVDLYFP